MLILIRERERASKLMKLRREIRRIEGFYNEGADEQLRKIDEELDEVSNLNVDKLMTNFGFAAIDDDLPKTFCKAWDHPDPENRTKWREAIRKEFRSMIKQGVWKKVKHSSVPDDQ